MAVTIENLEKAFDEMFDFITDLPSGLDGFESDFDAAFEELKELKATLTPPNEPLTLEQLRASPHGKIKDSTLQSICNRANEIACRPPEGEEDT